MIALGGSQDSERTARIAWMLILLIIMIAWGAFKPEAQMWYHWVGRHNGNIHDQVRTMPAKADGGPGSGQGR